MSYFTSVKQGVHANETTASDAKNFRSKSPGEAGGGMTSPMAAKSRTKSPELRRVGKKRGRR